MTGRPAALDERQVARARELRAEGLSVRAIAAELGVSKSPVGRALAPTPELIEVPESAPAAEDLWEMVTVRVNAPWPGDRVWARVRLVVGDGVRRWVDADGQVFCTHCQRLFSPAALLSRKGAGHPVSPWHGVRSWRLDSTKTGDAWVPR